MLDLIGKRDQAISRYQQMKEMNTNKSWMHTQYGMKYQLSPYAAERLETPFKRKENNILD